MTIHHHVYHVASVMAAKLLVVGVALGASTFASALQGPLSPITPPAAEVKSLDSVVIQTDEPAELERALNRKGLSVSDEVDAGRDRTYVEVDASLDDSRLKQLANEEDDLITGHIAPNLRYGITRVPNDTHYAQQWNLPKISAPTAWDTSTGSSDVTIAVVDTGVLSSQSWGSYGPYNNPDMPASKLWNNENEKGSTTQEGSAPNCTSRGLTLDKQCNNLDDDANGFIDDWRGWDFMGGWRGTTGICPNYADPTTYADPDFPNYITEDNDPQPYSCDDYLEAEQLNKDHYDNACGYGWGACVLGHGTSVASVAASASDNASLIAGVDWGARIMPLRALDGYGYGNSAQIAAAIDYASANGADVINLSLAMSIDGDCAITDSLVDAALSRAETAGSVVVAASGNEGTGQVCYPARSSKAIAVGASDSSDRRASFSSYGPELDLVAPGAAVPTANAPSKADPSSYDSAAYGTSFSAPHVSGAVALMKSIRPSLNLSDALSLLTGSADKVPAMNSTTRTNGYGYGRLNVHSALTDAGSKIPVYRLYSSTRRSHFYTASPSERDRAVRYYGFKYEGTAFYARKSSQQPTHAIYRLRKIRTGSYFYTASPSERDRAIRYYGYRYEGVGFKVLENDSLERPIYRLRHKSFGSYFYTRSPSERDRAIRYYGYRYEGVGFKAE